MIKGKGIAFRLGAPVLVGSVAIFLVIFIAGYVHSRRTILRNVEENAGNLARRIAHRVELVLAPVEKVPDNLDVVLETFSPSESQIVGVLRGTLYNNKEVFGVAVGFEPHAFDPSQLYFCPYLSRKDNAFLLTHLGNDEYRYFYQDWYQIPKETGKASWSEPYFDEGGGNILMATFSRPFYRSIEGKPHFTGVITADISLAWLAEIVSEIRVLKTGYGFIISRNGAFIAHPQKAWVMNETIFSIAEARGDAALRAVGKQMIAGKSGFIPFTGDAAGRPGFLYFTPIGFSKWSLGIFFPEKELMADLDVFRIRAIVWTIAGISFLTIMVWLVSRTITRPLTALARVTREMATGNLDIEIPVPNTGDELALLAESFTFMKDSLRIHIRELLEATAAREHMESELTIARDIQLGLLPKTFPPFPDIPHLDLHALLRPAREVGGDLYDFRRIDAERICFFLGDVSGKGIPASLFMAVSMALIRTTAAQGFGPDRILREVNIQLSRDNPTGMFVTLFCGMLNTSTRELWYANGGHNPPILIKNNGRSSFLEGTDGILLGVMDDIDYGAKRIVLEKGDGIFLYSDGVTEAINEAGLLYSEERLLDLLGDTAKSTSAQVIERVNRDIISFAGNAPQADDITMMMVRL